MLSKSIGEQYFRLFFKKKSDKLQLGNLENRKVYELNIKLENLEKRFMIAESYQILKISSILDFWIASGL